MSTPPGRKRGSEDQALGRSRGGLSTKIHMAVRGLGCPVRFTLTAGQKGDAPQAAALIEGLAAEVVMADTAYDADHLRQAIAAKGALAVIPNNRHVRSNIRSTSISMPSVISSNAASQNSSSSAASQPALGPRLATMRSILTARSRTWIGIGH
jgi:transposase